MKEICNFLPLLLQCLLSVNSLNIKHVKQVFAETDCILASSLTLEDEEIVDENSSLDIPQSMEKSTQDKSVLSQLQELAQYHSIDISYELVKEEGLPHEKTFTINLYLGDETYTGSDRTLKGAKRAAADQAIRNTKFEHPPVQIKKNRDIALTPTVLLNNLASKLGLSVKYFIINNNLFEELKSTNSVPIESKFKKSRLEILNDTIYSNHTLRFRKDDADLKGPFKIKVLVNGENFIGVDHTIQNAKHNAASKALKYLKGLKDKDNLHCLKDGSEDECKKAKQQNKSPISLVYEKAQLHQLQVEFEVIDGKGPSHKKTFIMKCTVGDFESTGQGNSKKEAKRYAAENMLSKLDSLPIPIDKKSKAPKELTQKESKNQKRRKKKKNKLIKTTLDKIDKYVENFVEFGANVIDKFSGGQEKPKNNKDVKDPQKSATAEILDLGLVLNLNLKFTDIHDDKNSKVFTLLDLGTTPSYICLGEGANQKNARDLASKRGIEFLDQLGLLDNLLGKTNINVHSEYEENNKFYLHVIEEKSE